MWPKCGAHWCSYQTIQFGPLDLCNGREVFLFSQLYFCWNIYTYTISVSSHTTRPPPAATFFSSLTHNSKKETLRQTIRNNKSRNTQNNPTIVYTFPLNIPIKAATYCLLRFCSFEHSSFFKPLCGFNEICQNLFWCFYKMSVICCNADRKHQIVLSGGQLNY